MDYDDDAWDGDFGFGGGGRPSPYDRYRPTPYETRGQFGYRDIGPQLRARINRLFADRVGRMERGLMALAKDVEQEMVSDAPWQDRTGTARGALFADPRTERRGRGWYRFTLELGYREFAPHGWWLEKRRYDAGESIAARVQRGLTPAVNLRPEDYGTYAIVDPTIGTLGPRIRAVLDRAWGSI